MLPTGLLPMLATTGTVPPEDGRWALEVKWDGVRVLVGVQNGTVQLSSRAGNAVTAAYPELAGLAAAVPCPVLLDGEVVALRDGRPDFGLLQERMHVRRPSPELCRRVPVTLVAFDVLHRAQTSLLDATYDERRAALATLELSGPAWQAPAGFTSDFAAIVTATRAQAMEGVVAKQRDSRYWPGQRSACWRKVKHVRRQSAVVVGWKDGDGGRSGRLGSLLLAVPGPAGLAYAGHVGTGFSVRSLAAAAALLAPLERPTPPVEDVPREHASRAHWVQPVLVAEVEYTAWTREGRLRHPSFKGWRTDLGPADVHREQEP